MEDDKENSFHFGFLLKHLLEFLVMNLFGLLPFDLGKDLFEIEFEIEIDFV